MVEVDGDTLRDAGYGPVHTPDQADSSHVDAPRLHHDIEQLDAVRGEVLRDLRIRSKIRASVVRHAPKTR